jgi:hypothetical protein
LHEALGWVSEWRPDVCFSHNMRPLDVDDRLAADWPVAKMMHGYFGTCVSGQKAHAFPGVQPCTREFGAACLPLYLPRRCGQLRPLKMMREFAWASRQRSLFASTRGHRREPAHGANTGVTECPMNTTVAPLFRPLECPPVRGPGLDPVVLFAA